MNAYDQTVLKTTNLSKTYYSVSHVDVTAVVDACLEIKQGEVVLIMGPNGSGKTTLLSMLGCLTKPSSGTVNILGHEITLLNQRELISFRLKYIGFVFQSFRLLDSLKSVDNVELVLNLSGIRRPESAERARALLEELNISHRADFFPNALSGGEKQLIAIARALINDPAIILADEPTGNLDSTAGKAAIELLTETVRCRNKTLIIVTHDQRIEHFAHRVLRMEDGHFTA
jgi:putative ABC transport system ATP-binding protein